MQVCGLSAGWDAGVGNEVDGLSAFGHVGKVSLGQTTKFVGAAGFPGFAFGAGAKGLVVGGFAGVGVCCLECGMNRGTGGVKPIQLAEGEAECRVFDRCARGGI